MSTQLSTPCRWTIPESHTPALTSFLICLRIPLPAGLPDMEVSHASSPSPHSVSGSPFSSWCLLVYLAHSFIQQTFTEPLLYVRHGAGRQGYNCVEESKVPHQFPTFVSDISFTWPSSSRPPSPPHPRPHQSHQFVAKANRICLLNIS